jgi:hypothetical protein
MDDEFDRDEAIVTARLNGESERRRTAKPAGNGKCRM